MSKIVTQFIGYLTDFGGFTRNLVANLDAAGKTNYQWLVILFFAFVLFLVGFTLGRTRMLIGLLAIYIAYFIESKLIFFDQLKNSVKGISEYQLHLALFFAIYLAVFLILNGSAIKHRLNLKEVSFGSVSLLAILEAGFLTSIASSYLPDGILPASIEKYFISPAAIFIWAVLPLAATIFIKSHHKKTREPLE